MEGFKPKTESRMEGLQGLDRLLKYLDNNDTGPSSHRAGKYIRSLYNSKKPEDLETLKLIGIGLDAEGYSFTMFEDMQVPGEVVEPLFENIMSARGVTAEKELDGARKNKEVKGAIRSMIQGLQNFETDQERQAA